MKWIPAAIAILTGVIGAVSGPIQGVIAANPWIGAVLAGAYGIIGLLLPNPLKKP